MRTNPSRSREPGLAALLARLDEIGIEAIAIEGMEDLDSLEEDEKPALGLIDVQAVQPSQLAQVLRECAHLEMPVIALVPADRIDEAARHPEITDFAVIPPRGDEVAVRARRILARGADAQSEEVIRVGTLVINPTTYDVSLAGKRVNLRFKEYELLRLLASNPGRVYTREALLSQIWGYDYLGGTRTVDVHIRRLRSKIETSGQQFVETIWNVGYRFRDPNA